MVRQFIIGFCLCLLAVLALLLLFSPKTSAGMVLEPTNGTATVEAETFPVYFNLSIQLDGPTAAQVDYIYWQSDEESQKGGVIGGSVIRFYVDQGLPINQRVAYDQAGEFTIVVYVYNNSYSDGTEKPEDEKLILEGSYFVTVLEADSESPNDSTTLMRDIVVYGLWAAVLVWVMFASIFGQPPLEAEQEQLPEVNDPPDVEGSPPPEQEVESLHED